MKLFVQTNAVSPHLVAIFDAVAKHCELTVAYGQAHLPQRYWGQSAVGHPALFAATDGAAIREACDAADLAIFTQYRSPLARKLMDRRHASGKPWCFWGERPGKLSWYSFAGPVLRRLLLRQLHGSRIPVWGIGRFGIEGYRREFGDRRLYLDVPYAVDLAPFRAAGLDRRPAPERRLLYCGRLIAIKGFDLLMAAYAQAAAAAPNLTLTVLGDGELKHLIDNAPAELRTRISFLGAREYPEVPRVLAGADIVCGPSRIDGWGMFLVEALAAGAPVIASDRVGAAVELLEPRRNGWIVPAGDVAALAATLVEAATIDDARLSAMSEAARASATEVDLPAAVERVLSAAQTTLRAFATENLFNPG